MNDSLHLLTVQIKKIVCRKTKVKQSSFFKLKEIKLKMPLTAEVAALQVQVTK